MSEALAAAIEEFRGESFMDCYDEQIEVADLAHPDLAMGNCHEVSEAFLDFLTERGIEATVIHTDDATTWGYQGTSRLGFPIEHGGIHFAVKVGDTMIDWTASQFIGESALPVVTEAPHG